MIILKSLKYSSITVRNLNKIAEILNLKVLMQAFIHLLDEKINSFLKKKRDKI